MPLVSIALAVYNAEKNLREQVESILNQTVQDIELIMCDDRSTDGSWNLMNKLSKEDNRIHIFQNDQNMGFKKNFEEAIKHCSGKYIALSDDDDIWEKNHLEQLLKIIGDKALACGNSTFVDDNGKSLGMTLKYQEALDWIPRNDMKKFLSIALFRNPYQGATMLMKREFLSKALPIPDNVPYHDTWFASMACFCGGISYTSHSLMKYRRLKTSVTGLREQRKSKWRRFVRPWIPDDRMDVLTNIQQRLNDAPPSQTNTLNTLEQIIKIYKKHRRDLRFLAYMLLNYKSIFSCDLTHWL